MRRAFYCERLAIAEAATDPEGRVTEPPDTVRFDVVTVFVALTVPETSSVYAGLVLLIPMYPLLPLCTATCSSSYCHSQASGFEWIDLRRSCCLWQGYGRWQLCP